MERTFFLKHFFFVVAITLVFSNCNLLGPDKDDWGSGTITASIDGITKTSDDANCYNSFHQIYGWAKLGDYSLQLYLARGEKGQYNWGKPYTWIFMRIDTTASLNGMFALEGIGGLTIKYNDAAKMEIAGTFAFAIIDTATHDTVRVTKGSFTLRYVEKE